MGLDTANPGPALTEGLRGTTRTDGTGLCSPQSCPQGHTPPGCGQQRPGGCPAARGSRRHCSPACPLGPWRLWPGPAWALPLGQGLRPGPGPSTPTGSWPTFHWPQGSCGDSWARQWQGQGSRGWGERHPLASSRPASLCRQTPTLPQVSSQTLGQGVRDLHFPGETVENHARARAGHQAPPPALEAAAGGASLFGGGASLLGRGRGTCGLCSICVSSWAGRMLQVLLELHELGPRAASRSLWSPGRDKGGRAQGNHHSCAGRLDDSRVSVSMGNGQVIGVDSTLSPPQAQGQSCWDGSRTPPSGHP